MDVDCAVDPIEVGETRILRVSGKAPFSVTIGRFVTDPPPLGLRPQLEASVESLGSSEAFEIRADPQFWSQHRGALQIDITDAGGARRRVHINVRPMSRGAMAGLSRA
jgi:hypothetical protein